MFIIVRMDVPARGVGLPHLDQRTGERGTPFIKHAQAHLDKLPESTFNAVSGEVGTEQGKTALRAIGAGQLREREGPLDQGFGRRTQGGLPIALDHRG